MSGLLRRMGRVGLRWRLAGWVALAILICTAITFIAVYSGTGTEVRGQIDHQLAGDASEFARSIEKATPREPTEGWKTNRVLNVSAKAARRYVESQPFSASSTTLFAIVPNRAPITNVPELFPRGSPEDHGSIAKQQREARVAAQLRTSQIGYHTIVLPDGSDLRLYKAVVLLPASPSYTENNVVIGVGEPLAPVSRAQESVAGAFILAAALALIIALVGAYLIGSRMSRPLRRMAAVAALVDGGDLHHRIHDSRMHGNEIGVLADAFNHMLDRLTDAFASQRAFVADASHELRTPLTVIRGQLEVLAALDSPTAEEVRRVDRLLQAEVARIGRLVDDLLLLVKSEQSEFLRIEPIDIEPFVSELWDATVQLAERRFVLECAARGTLLADPDRLAQVLRNLLRNAIEHTQAPDGLVRMRVEGESEDRIRFVVEDDGPGIAPEERERVFDRFHRTDSARDRASGGTGLGLAIVAAITTAHEGSVRAEEASSGGARLVLELPRFEAAQALRARSSPSRTSA